MFFIPSACCIVSYDDDETRSAGCLLFLTKLKQTNAGNETIIAPPGKGKALLCYANTAQNRRPFSKQMAFVKQTFDEILDIFAL